jgi:hypothetical protein
MLDGCKHAGVHEALVAGGMEAADANRACMSVRTDGRSVDIDGDYTETLARIDANPNGIGVFGLPSTRTTPTSCGRHHGRRRADDRDRSPRATTRCRVRCTSTSRRPTSA